MDLSEEFWAYLELFSIFHLKTAKIAPKSFALSGKSLFFSLQNFAVWTENVNQYKFEMHLTAGQFCKLHSEEGREGKE